MSQAAESIVRDRKRVSAVPDIWLAEDEFHVIFRMPDGAETCFDMDYRTAIQGVTTAQKVFLLGRVVPWIAGDRPAHHATDSRDSVVRGRRAR
jgi:hypothetical protein